MKPPDPEDYSCLYCTNCGCEYFYKAIQVRVIPAIHIAAHDDLVGETHVALCVLCNTEIDMNQKSQLIRKENKQ